MGLSPLMQRAISQRKATIRSVKQFSDRGLIDSEAAAEIEQELSSHEEGEITVVLVDPEAQSALETWAVLGLPCMVLTGLSNGVDDRRDRLFHPRLEMLRMAGAESDAIEIYFRLWGALDEEYIAFEYDSLGGD